MFDRLFNAQTTKDDGLTQPQREAMVDLLHYCMYADSLITITENKFISGKVDSFSWDPKISFEYYQGKSIGAARGALAKPDAKEAFFASINQRLGTSALRQQAFELCSKLFAADGTEPASELAVQGEVRKALGLPAA